MSHPGITVSLDALSHAVLVNMLNNIARMLEAGYDPLVVAGQIRTFIDLKRQKEETGNMDELEVMGIIKE